MLKLDDATQFTYFMGEDSTLLGGLDSLKDKKTNHVPLPVGSLFLDKYKILKVLGEGSFSFIYLLEAMDVSKKLLVAKEFFPKGLVTRVGSYDVALKSSLSKQEIENYHFMKDIFIGEAKNLVKVSYRVHPNVLNFFALEENVNMTTYLITDYEEGITLKEYLVKIQNESHRGKLTNSELKTLASKLLDGLDHIHKVKVFHQDIKLDNILICHDKSPLLLDFGASVILYDIKRKKHFNAITPRYAAPEQVYLSQPPKINESSDIYALGVLLYKLITNTFPVKASERVESLKKGLPDPYRPLKIQKISGYDSSLLKAVDKSLQIGQKQRFQDAMEFKKALKSTKRYKVVAFMIPSLLVFAIFSYFLWPNSKGLIRLNFHPTNYLLYSDGKEVKQSKEKPISLPIGEHTLTVIKEGFMTFSKKVTISENQIEDVSGMLIPTSHSIALNCNVEDAKFEVNSRVLKEPFFIGRYGQTYKVSVVANGYMPQIETFDYQTLFQQDFFLYQKLLPDNNTLKIPVKIPFRIGETIVKVNGLTVSDDTITIEHGKRYRVDITNPYYKEVHIEGSYDELKIVDTLVPSLGVGKIVLKGLPSRTKISLYRKYKGIVEKVEVKGEYSQQKYIFNNIPAFDKIYFKFSKKGYYSLETSIFSLRAGESQVRHHHLIKKKLHAKSSKKSRK